MLTTNKLQDLIVLYKSILEGGKPNVEKDSPLYRFFTKIHEKGFSPYIADELVSYDDHKAKGISTDHPFQEAEIQPLKLARKMVGKEAANIRVIGGFGFAYNDGKVKGYTRELDDDQLSKVINAAYGFVVPEQISHYGTFEFLRILKAKINAVNDIEQNGFLSRKLNGDNTFIDKPIILLNEGEFLKEIFEHIGVTKEDLKDYGVHFLETKNEKKDIRKIFKNQYILNSQKIKFPIEIEKRPEDIFHAQVTGSSVKEAEYIQILKHYSVNLGVSDQITGINAPDPDELHGTLPGNARGVRDIDKNSGKMEAFLAQVTEKCTATELRTKLQELGYNTDYFECSTEDRGGYFGQDGAEIMKHFDYTNIPSKFIHEYNPRPYEEISHYVQACGGIEGFMKRYHEAADKADEERERNNLAQVNREMFSYSTICYARVKLNDYGAEKPFDYENIVIKTFGGQDCLPLTKEPFPKNPSTLELEHYKTTPDGKPFFDGTSFEERTKLLSVGKATEAMAYGLGLNEKGKNAILGEDRSRRYVVGLTGPKEGKDLEELKRRIKVSYGIESIIFEDTSPLSLHGFENKFLRQADVWINIGGEAKLTQQQMLQETWEHFSMVVQKQVDPRDRAKLWIKLNPSEDQKLIIDASNQTYDQRYSGSYPPGLHQIFEGRGALENALNEIKYHALNYRKGKYNYHDDSFNIYQPLSELTAFVGLSASIKSTRDLLEARKLTKGLLDAGINIMYGVSDKAEKPMGAIFDTFNQYKLQNPNSSVKLYGSTAPQFLSKETLDGKPNLFNTTEYYHAPGEPGRLSFQIAKSHFTVILSGGPGTIQEAIGSAKMDPNRHIIVLNRKKNNGEGKVFDAFLNIFNQEKIGANNITVALNTGEALHNIKNITIQENPEFAKVSGHARWV